MLAKLLKPVKELFDLFRKQNVAVKVIVIVSILLVARVITERLTWGIFSQTYLENFGVGASGSEMVLVSYEWLHTLQDYDARMGQIC